MIYPSNERAANPKWLKFLANESDKNENEAHSGESRLVDIDLPCPGHFNRGRVETPSMLQNRPLSDNFFKFDL